MPTGSPHSERSSGGPESVAKIWASQPGVGVRTIIFAGLAGALAVT